MVALGAGLDMRQHEGPRLFEIARQIEFRDRAPVAGIGLAFADKEAYSHETAVRILHRNNPVLRAVSWRRIT